MDLQRQQPDVHPIRDTDKVPLVDALDGSFEAKRYTVQDVIGRGSYGTVYSALDVLTGEKVAIKKVHNVFENVPDAVRILREIKLLRLLKHPDIVGIKHILLPPHSRNFKDIYIVFELLEADLHTVLAANDVLTLDHHKVFLYQLLRGLDFIHASGVLHRDLKPKNILVNSNCKLKVCDFGLARPFLPEHNMTPVFWTDYVATRWYRAPELCGCFYGKYSQAVDIWSVGCIFAEVLTGKPLFPGRDTINQLQLIMDLLGKPPQAVIDAIANHKARAFVNAQPARLPHSFESKFPMADPLALDLLRRMLAFDRLDRPTAAEALEHPYFAGLPTGVCTEGVAFSRSDFAFENAKLAEAEVRQLIYHEILSYHPAVLATMEQHAPCQVQYLPFGANDIHHQFLVAEHRGMVNAV